MNNRRLIIDTDTASDDAVALIMAHHWPGVTVEAVTVVSGNMPLPQASRNARATIALCGAATPVYEGADRPLLRPVAHADWFHGPDGLSGVPLPEPRPAHPGHAVPELIRRFAAAPGAIELVTLGPLTNIALALRQEPQLVGWVKRCVVMGGAANTVGNVTPAAEYNIWCDPEAADIVFRSGMEILMVGWEHSRGAATLSDAEMAMVRDFGTPRARFAIDCNAFARRAIEEIQKEKGLGLADPVAMAVALDPTICTRMGRYPVAISLDRDLTRGMTIVDELGVTGQPANAGVCQAVDTIRWKEALYRTLL